MIDIDVDARLLAIRDEDPERTWDSLGAWWPDRPGVSGIRDRRAGGAWLAVEPTQRRLAVLLNRADVLDLPEKDVVSRGILALESVAGRMPSPEKMHGFNLLEVGPNGARVRSWDGKTLRDTVVPDGVHMIAHDDLDDDATARIARWLPVFQNTRARSDAWEQEWVGLLAESAKLDPTDDAAIIRDNRPHGYPTQSLLYCVATVSAAGVQVHETVLPTPGHW